MSFSFVKKKHNPTQTTQPQTIQPTESTNLPKPQATQQKKGFSFIKKTTAQPQQQQEPPQQSNPARSLDSLLTDDLLLLSKSKVSEETKNSSQTKMPIVSAQNEYNEGKNDNNQINSDVISNLSKEKDNQSITEKKSGKGVSFLKKKKNDSKPQSINLAPSPQQEEKENQNTSANNLFTNLSEETNSINFQTQQQEEFELHLSKEGKDLIQDHDQSEDNFSVSSKNKTISKSEFKIEANPKLLYEQINLKKEIDESPIINRQNSKLNITKEAVDEQLVKQKNNSKNNYLNYISNIHCLKLKLKSKNEELKNLNLEKEKLYKEEQIAIEENDFEKADHIESSIKEFNNKIININAIVSQCNKELMENREKELNLMRGAIKEIEEISENYGKLKSNIEDKIETFNNNEMAKHKSENIRLQKMNEKLQFLKSNLDTEKNYIDTEEEKINEVIKGQSKGIFDDLDNLHQEKELLNEEINKLKRQLELKENELDQLNAKIESKEIEIDAIKSNFNHEFNKIEIKKKNYSESLRDYEEQHNNYNKKMEDYNTQDVKYENYLSEMKKQTSQYDNEMSNIQNIITVQQTDINLKQNILQRENDIFSLISSYENKIDLIKHKIQKHKEDIQSLNVSNKLMESEITQIEIRLPALEEEKKGFVQTKNFKEAGRVSHELKASLEKKAKNQELIKQNKTNIELYQKELTDFENNIKTLESEKEVHERELNIAKYEHLINYLDTLNSYIDENRANGDLIDEIRFTKEEMEYLMQFDYIKLKFNEQTNTNTIPTSITPNILSTPADNIENSKSNEVSEDHIEETKVKLVKNKIIKLLYLMFIL